MRPAASTICTRLKEMMMRNATMQRATDTRVRRMAKCMVLMVPLALASHAYAQGTAGGVGAPAGAGGVTGSRPGAAGIPPAAGAMPGAPTIQPGSPGPTVPPPGSPSTAPINPAPGTSTITPPPSPQSTAPGSLGGVTGSCNCPSPAATGLPPGTPADVRGGVAGGRCAC